MTDNKINQLIETSLEKIKELSETETVIGEKIVTDNGTTIIPVSKVSIGFASGGVDLGGRLNKDGTEKKSASFGGGGGTGVSITPVGFLIIKSDGDVEMLNVTSPASTNSSPIAAVGDILEKSPDIIKKFKNLFSKEKEKEADELFAEDEDKDIT